METNNAGVRQALERADQALTSIEEVLDSKEIAPEIVPMAQLAVSALLRAFIIFKGEEPAASELKGLWNQCVSLESEFLELQDTMEYLLPEPSPAEDWDAEDYSEILDATNEVWDFTVGFFPESMLP